MTEQDLLTRYQVTQVFRGQGAVRSYKATTLDGHAVSLKIVEAEPSEALAAVERLSVLRSIAHPSLARSIEAEVVESGYAVVREWLDGTSLDARPLPTGSTTTGVSEWVAEAADALAAVHAAGLVHGDVRPSNIVVDAQGRAKLVDVGIPPAHGRVPEPGAAAATAYYTSPEELAGQAPTWSSDIYRLGAVLYELEAGRPPFDGPDAGAVAQAHQSTTPPPMSTVNPAVAPVLDGVAATALQELPSSRYASATAMASALRAAAGGQPKTGGSRWWLWILVGAIVVLAIIVAFLLAGGNTVVVPDVVGKTQAEAAAAIEAVGLKVGSVVQEETSDAEPGTVLSQDPAAGQEADEGSEIDLVISAVPEVTVPDVVGMTQEEATVALEAAGLAVGTVTPKETADAAPGTVIEQKPAAGEAANQGSPVELTLAAAQEVEVPDVVNMTQGEATAAIEAVGLKVGSVSEEASDRVAAGLVITQDPRAGTKLATGSEVKLVLATAAPITVPGVTGQPITDAATTLLQSGLVIGQVDYAYDGGVAAGYVISQNPAAGAEAPKGSPVSVVVSLGAEQGLVPGVVGLTEPDAVATIQAAGFAAETQQQPDAGVPAGEVMAQTPEPGTSLAAGSVVSIIVSAGSGEQVTVPDLVGQNIADALVELGRAGLTFSLEYAQDEQVLVVLAQDPPGGTQVYVGSSVKLTVGVPAQ